MTRLSKRFCQQFLVSATSLISLGIAISCSKSPSDATHRPVISAQATLNGNILTLSQTASKLITIETAKPSELSSIDHIAALGIATAFSDAKSVVNSRVRAKITALPILVGRTVTAGQIVAMLESEDLHNAQTAYRLAVERVKLAQTMLKRHHQLATLSGTTAHQLDAAIADCEAAEGQYSQATIDASVAKAKVADLEALIAQADIDRTAAARKFKLAEAAEAQAETLYADQIISRFERERVRAQLADADDSVRLMASVRNATIARLETSRLERDAANDKVAVIKRAVERTAKAMTRARKVFTTSTQLNKDVIEAQSALDEARIEMDSAADDIQLLGGKAGDNHTIFIAAPISGVVSEQHATVGNTVDMNTPILTIVDRNKVGVTVNIKPTDLAFVEVGSRIQVSVSKNSRLITGAVMSIGTIVEEATGMLPIRVQLPAGSNLRQGTLVTARIPITHGKLGIAIPASTVTTVNGKSLVFTQQNANTFQLHEVKIIQSTASDTLLISGIQPHDVIVTKGASALLAAAEAAGYGK